MICILMLVNMKVRYWGYIIQAMNYFAWNIWSFCTWVLGSRSFWILHWEVCVGFSICRNPGPILENCMGLFERYNCGFVWDLWCFLDIWNSHANLLYETHFFKKMFTFLLYVFMVVIEKEQCNPWIYSTPRSASWSCGGVANFRIYSHGSSLEQIILCLSCRLNIVGSNITKTLWD